MPRKKYDWAKVYCDLLRHPLLLGRPDSDKVLVVGLILYAKEYAAPDGVLKGIDAEQAKRLFGIEAPLKNVEDGLRYLLHESPVDEAGRHWLLELDGALAIRDFVDRQKRAGDTHAAHNNRQRAYLARGKEEAQRAIDLSLLNEKQQAEVRQLLHQGRPKAAIKLFASLRRTG